MSQENLMTVKEAEAAGYGSRPKLMRFVNSGKLPAVRLGRIIYFKKEDLDKLYEPMNAAAQDAFVRLTTEISRALPELTEENKKQLIAFLSA